MKKIITLLIIVLTLLCCSCKKKEVIYYCYSLTDDKQAMNKAKEFSDNFYNWDLKKCYGTDYRNKMKIGKPLVWFDHNGTTYTWRLLAWIDSDIVYQFYGGDKISTGASWHPSNYVLMHAYSAIYSGNTAEPEWYKYRSLTTENQPMYLYTTPGNSQYPYEHVYVIIGNYAYNIYDSNDIRKKDDLPGIENIDLSNTHVNAVTMDD